MKNFKIGDKITRVPLIQGGMGVVLADLQVLLRKQEELVLFPLHRSATGKKISTEIRQQPTNVPLPVK
jgi:hypothetical protein